MFCNEYENAVDEFFESIEKTRQIKPELLWSSAIIAVLGLLERRSGAYEGNAEDPTAGKDGTGCDADEVAWLESQAIYLDKLAEEIAETFEVR